MAGQYRPLFLQAKSGQRSGNVESSECSVLLECVSVLPGTRKEGSAICKRSTLAIFQSVFRAPLAARSADYPHVLGPPPLEGGPGW